MNDKIIALKNEIFAKKRELAELMIADINDRIDTDEFFGMQSCKILEYYKSSFKKFLNEYKKIIAEQNSSFSYYYDLNRDMEKFNEKWLWLYHYIVIKNNQYVLDYTKIMVTIKNTLFTEKLQIDKNIRLWIGEYQDAGFYINTKNGSLEGICIGDKDVIKVRIFPPSSPDLLNYEFTTDYIKDFFL